MDIHKIEIVDQIKEIDIIVKRNHMLTEHYLNLIYALQITHYNNSYVNKIIHVSSRETSNILHANIFFK